MMKLTQILVKTGLILAAVTPLTTHAAAESSLNGWGSAFSKIHAASQGGESSASAQGEAKGSLTAAVTPEKASSPAADKAKDMGNTAGEKAKETSDKAKESMTAAADKIDQQYTKGGEKVDELVAKVASTTEGLLGKLGGEVNLGAEGLLGQTLKVGDVASLTSDLSAVASLQLAGVSQISQVASLTTGLVQNIIAARPASLTGLLR